MKPELPWMGVLSVIRIFSFLNVRDWPVKCKCTNIISLLTAIITLNTFYEKVFMQDQVDMFCERCCSQSPSCNKLELCLKEMNFTDSQFRICSAKIVPLPHIGCRKHWLASLSFMTNPITSFNIPPAHDPTSLWGPLWGQVLLIVLSYEIHFLLNAEAAIWFFFSLCYCCCFVISLWGGMPDHKVHDCQPFSDLCTTADLSSSSKRTKLQQKYIFVFCRETTILCFFFL